VYLKRCAIFSGRLSVGSVIAFYHTTWHHHSKYRRAHADGITLASIRLEPRSSSAFYFDSYGLSPNVLDIQTFLRRNCTILNYNTIQLQGPTSMVCGQYCCLFALYMDIGYTGQQFVGLFDPRHIDLQVERLHVRIRGPTKRRSWNVLHQYV